MRKLIVFNMITVDGFFEGENHDLGWHHVDEEFNKFAIKQLKSIDAIIFGRRTYEMMAAYWPTPKADADDPTVARLMNKKLKYVISNSMEKADWKNTKLIKDDTPNQIKQLKEQRGKDLIIFGSSDLVVSLLKYHLIDEIRVIVNPLFLGSGKLLFQGILQKQPLELIKGKVFKSGNVLLEYEVKLA